MALLNDFYEFKGSVRTTGSPLILATGGSATIQETYLIENMSPEDASVLVSTDGGTTWIAVPPGEQLSVLTALGAGPDIRIAGNGPIYRGISIRDPNATPQEYLHRVRVSPLHSAKVA